MRHAEALGDAEGHVGAQFARRGQQHQGQQVGSDAGQRAAGRAGARSAGRRSRISPWVSGYCSRAPNTWCWLEVLHSADDQLEAEAFGAGLHHGDGLRMTVFVDEEHVALRLRHAFGQGHGFGCGGGFVEQRGVGQLQAR